ncbi:hypothetical protein EYF80_033034 [Liparis tanakae]|uniref:Uncharacterized protein n=1 Tax=Liparis tanakae TaxID=230148 RepID=A0A4Z2GTD7_9TELE|nr:hypothetical protein EYF80_033034 [Liparis tanakae]
MSERPAECFLQRSVILFSPSPRLSIGSLISFSGHVGSPSLTGVSAPSDYGGKNRSQLGQQMPLAFRLALALRTLAPPPRSASTANHA